MNKKILSALFFLLFLAAFSLGAQDLQLYREDVRIEMRADGGFHLFIRKKPAIGSVLLTESTSDPSGQAANYAYRAGEWNPINGDEIRILNGVPIPRESRIYSLISSTVVNHPDMGAVFHIYIPYALHYGYEGIRSGQVHVTDGTYLNIRAFALPYADYRGAFRDNPFVLEAKQDPPPVLSDENYIPEAVDAFTEIAESGGGDLILADDPDDMVDRIRDILGKEKGKNLDLVICIDTTGSMRTSINTVRQKLIPALRQLLEDFSAFRIGMVLFRDYNEEYLTRIIPFTNDFVRFQRNLNAARAAGGGDIPEAVYEALYDGAVKFPWVAESRVMILIGDAPPHPKPRGKITKDMVTAAAAERSIKVHTILLPAKK
ncbi:MAG: VWA domain-containing protein [Treponema sp.]|nr:VWA domain-containing protein [Treponema sp.]